VRERPSRPRGALLGTIAPTVPPFLPTKRHSYASDPVLQCRAAREGDGSRSVEGRTEV
jgi:hypothetical protein